MVYETISIEDYGFRKNKIFSFDVESSRFVIISNSDSMVEMDLLPWLPWELPFVLISALMF